jgi:hypothetical protein
MKKVKKVHKVKSWVEENMTDMACSLKLHRGVERD